MHYSRTGKHINVSGLLSLAMCPSRIKNTVKSISMYSNPTMGFPGPEALWPSSVTRVAEKALFGLSNHRPRQLVYSSGVWKPPERDVCFSACPALQAPHHSII